MHSHLRELLSLISILRLACVCVLGPLQLWRYAAKAGLIPHTNADIIGHMQFFFSLTVTLELALTIRDKFLCLGGSQNYLQLTHYF
jgi:hypothetical protein